MLSPSKPLKSVLSKVSKQSAFVDKAVMRTGRKKLRGQAGKVTRWHGVVKDATQSRPYLFTFSSFYKF
jgi:hypothetical protein